MAALLVGLLVDWGRVFRDRNQDPVTTLETNPASASR
jgi:hypothetical protein